MGTKKSLSAHPLETKEVLGALLNTQPPEKLTLIKADTGKSHTFYSDENDFIWVPKDEWIVTKTIRLRKGVRIRAKD